MKNKHSKKVKTKSDKETFANIEKNLKIKKLKRQAFIEKVDDYCSLFTTKGLGSFFLIVGLSELVFPELLPIVLVPPLSPPIMISISMSLLLKKRAISTMQKFLKMLANYDEDEK